MDLRKKPQVGVLGLKYGVMQGALGVLLTVLVQSLQLPQMVGNLRVLFFVVLLVLAHLEYRRKGDDTMSYGAGLGIGTLMALVSSVIASIYAYLATPAAAVDGPSGPGAGAIAVMQLLIGLVFGFVVSLIVAALTRKRPQALAV